MHLASEILENNLYEKKYVENTQELYEKLVGGKEKKKKKRERKRERKRE